MGAGELWVTFLLKGRGARPGGGGGWWLGAHEDGERCLPRPAARWKAAVSGAGRQGSL